MNAKEEEGNKEVLITKEYKTMGGFLRGCRTVMNNVFGDGWGEDMLTMVTDYVHDERTVEEKIRAGDFAEYNHGSGLDYKAGFEFEFPDRIYAFNIEREGRGK